MLYVFIFINISLSKKKKSFTLVFKNEISLFLIGTYLLFSMVFVGSKSVKFDTDPDSDPGSNPTFDTDPDPEHLYGSGRSGSATLVVGV